MELNEVETTHEHATVSLKVMLLIFALILVGALAYLVWQQNRAVDTTDYSAPATKKASSESTIPALACGNAAEYGFVMTFGSLWNGYKIKQVTPDYALVTCYFNLPTVSTETVWTTESTDHFANYSSVFAVSVYTPAQWTTAQAEANPPTKLGETSAYVWGWAPAQALPQDLQDKKIADDVKNVVATFEIVS